MSFDPARIREQFAILRQGAPLHYLDNAATAQMPEPVLAAMAAHERTARANVRRGLHRLADLADRAYEDARETVARHLGVAPGEVIFTAGTTAGLNLLAWSLGERLGPGDEIVVTELDHHSNIVPWQLAARRRGATVRCLPVTAEGRLDLTALPRVVGPRCRVLAATHASNVTGAVSDTATLAAAARAVGALLVLDGAQMAQHGALDLPSTGADFYVFSGHKCYGPTGIGVLWGRAELLDEMPPALAGGGMVGEVTCTDSTWAAPPYRFEAGTPPVAQAVGLAAALEWMGEIDWPAARRHERALAGRALDGLLGLGARIVGPDRLDERLPILSFALEGVHPHDVAQVLDGHGVAVRAGTMCAQPLLAAVGLNGATRASLSLINDEADIDALLAGVGEAVRKLV